jgi:hypothetical protein
VVQTKLHYPPSHSKIPLVQPRFPLIGAWG